MNINSMYFSPTGTTKKIVCGLSKELIDYDVFDVGRNIEFTLPDMRTNEINFSEKDIVILGVPIYAGRVPNVLLTFLGNIKGNGAIGIPVVVYGNRNYDDGLIELKEIMESSGFKIIGAGAFIGEHSFSNILAKNRPDSKDMEYVKFFASEIHKKYLNFDSNEKLKINGNKPYRDYYRPRNSSGESVDIRKVKPKTNDQCINCKLCVKICPMGSIDFDSPDIVKGICIKCGACIKRCPVDAKFYDDDDYLRHKVELEIEFSKRRDIELFV